MKGSVNSSAVQVLGIITALLVISSSCLGSCAQTLIRRHHSIVEKALGSGARSGFQLCNTGVPNAQAADQYWSVTG